MTDFAKSVKMRLIALDKPSSQLCAEVSELTGLYFDTSYLSKILRGKRRAPKLVAAICEILDLPAGDEKR